MDFLKKYKCVTSHHTSLLLRIVSHPDTVLCSNGARFVLYVLQLSRSACCFHYATKMHFLACHFYSQKCLLLRTALLHYFCLLLRPSRSRCNKFSAANSNQYPSASTKSKAVSYFYHHTTTHSPTLQKIFATTPSSGTPHTHVIAATSPCRHTHIMSTMGAMQFARFCAAAILLPRMSNYFFAKNAYRLAHKNQSYSHHSANLTPPPS